MKDDNCREKLVLDMQENLRVKIGPENFTGPFMTYNHLTERKIAMKYLGIWWFLFIKFSASMNFDALKKVASGTHTFVWNI